MGVGRSLVSQLDVEVVLQEVLDAARELTGARYAALGILDDNRRGLERFLTLGVDGPTRTAIGDLPKGRGVLGLLIDDPKPLRLENVENHPRSFGFPAGHPPMETFLGVPIKIRGEAYGNLYLTEKFGGPFDQADEEAAIVLAEWAAIAIENARLYAGVQDRRRELERAVTGLEATTEVARAVGGETDLNRMLETIVKRARALVEARSLAILLEDQDELEVVATAGEFTRDVRGERLAIGWTTWGGILRGLRPERVRDVGNRLGIAPGDLGVEAAAALLVPLQFRGQGLGVIAAFDRLEGGPEFDQEDERLLLAFAASAATAVATAQSVAEEQLRHSIEASERERRRWARELHDETLQGLGALRVVLASASRTGSQENLRDAVERAVNQLSDEITSLRGLISELRPAALDELGLAAAVEALVEPPKNVRGLDIRAYVSLNREADPEQALDLTPELQSTIYRVIQEGLTNIAKHARAENVELRLGEQGGVLMLLLKDDGQGFETEAHHSGFGLLGMRERLELAGGRLAVISESGAGTELRASVPVGRSPGQASGMRRSA
jgi:signal transduction histidine kinase